MNLIQIIVALVVILVLWLILTYNRFVTLRNRAVRKIIIIELCIFDCGGGARNHSFLRREAENLIGG